MGQFFTDDIDVLLKSGHGDSERLSKIKADFATKKLVTLEDRRYVEGLVSRYIKPQVPEPERIVKIPEKRIVPPPSPPPMQGNTFELKYKQKPEEKKLIPKIGGKMKARNIVIAVCAIVAAILAVSYAAISQDQMTGVDTPEFTQSIELDSTSYARGDIVSISGKTRTVTSIVKLSITNPGGQEIWSETVNVKSDGIFSTLAIAGGAGWEQAGKYTVSATYSGIADTVSFDFIPSAAN